ncbi:hypothetical protein [Aliikangiella coralliicola]|uniref:Uncharacterized protein n=1 Tax=Aliikangiella coralliicola TaxID=2592383 RepID=A0A545U0F9_9GAMM|nr:hypothetical protein [Aliikangiella coralliicola]TQV82945.1 hypothetical protein FLL46_24555 [Aliikangiella coralliicola]
MSDQKVLDTFLGCWQVFDVKNPDHPVRKEWYPNPDVMFEVNQIEDKLAVKISVLPTGGTYDGERYLEEVEFILEGNEIIAPRKEVGNELEFQEKASMDDEGYMVHWLDWFSNINGEITKISTGSYKCKQISCNDK